MNLPAEYSVKSMEIDFRENSKALLRLTTKEELEAAPHILRAELGSEDPVVKRMEKFMTAGFKLEEAVFYGKEAWHVFSAFMRRATKEDGSPEFKVASGAILLELDVNSIAPVQYGDDAGAARSRNHSIGLEPVAAGQENNQSDQQLAQELSELAG